MRALIEALEPVDWFESLTVYSAAVMVFELATLLSPWAGESTLHNDNNVVE